MLGSTLQALPDKLSFRVVCEKDRINKPGQRAGVDLPAVYQGSSSHQIFGDEHSCSGGRFNADNDSNANNNRTNVNTAGTENGAATGAREKGENSINCHSIGVVLNAGGIEGRHMILNYMTEEEEAKLISCIDRLLEITGEYMELVCVHNRSMCV